MLTEVIIKASGGFGTGPVSTPLLSLHFVSSTSNKMIRSPLFFWCNRNNTFAVECYARISGSCVNNLPRLCLAIYVAVRLLSDGNVPFVCPLMLSLQHLLVHLSWWLLYPPLSCCPCPIQEPCSPFSNGVVYAGQIRSCEVRFKSQVKQNKPT